MLYHGYFVFSLKRIHFNLCVYVQAHRCASISRVLKRVSDLLALQLYTDGCKLPSVGAEN